MPLVLKVVEFRLDADGIFNGHEDVVAIFRDPDFDNMVEPLKEVISKRYCAWHAEEIAEELWDEWVHSVADEFEGYLVGYIVKDAGMRRFVCAWCENPNEEDILEEVWLTIDTQWVGPAP